MKHSHSVIACIKINVTYYVPGTKPAGKETSKSATPGKSSKVTTSSAGKSTTTEQNGKGKAASTSGAKTVPKKPTRKIESINLLPPLNLVMQDVSSYKTSGEFWLSDSFLSHQLGYRLSLAVKLEAGSAENHTKVTLALMPAKGKHSPYLDYPCIGNATVIILNPEDNSNHETVDFLFMFEKKDSQTYPDMNEQTEIQNNFIRKDCIFFRVDKIEMNERPYKLWLLDPKKYKC